MEQCLLPTSAKVRLTIPIRVRDDRQQNLIIYSLAHSKACLKNSCKFVWKFLR